MATWMGHKKFILKAAPPYIFCPHEKEGIQLELFPWEMLGDLFWQGLKASATDTKKMKAQ